MGYLLPAEYEAYGLSDETADAWVNAASAMMEAYCKRPSLLSAAYTERLAVGRRTYTVRLSYGPVQQVTAPRARFGRSEDEVAAAFCAAGEWTTLDVASLEVDGALSEVRLPFHLLGATFTEAEITYTAGVAAADNALKVACAQIVKNAQATPGLNVKSSRVDTLQMEYFSDALLDVQVRALLQPYVAERLS